MCVCFRTCLVFFAPRFYFPACLPGFLGFPFLTTEVTRVLLILRLPMKRLLALRLGDRLGSSTPSTVTADHLPDEHSTLQSNSFNSQALWTGGITNEDKETKAQRLCGLPKDHLAEKWQSRDPNWLVGKTETHLGVSGSQTAGFGPLVSHGNH